MERIYLQKAAEEDEEPASRRGWQSGLGTVRRFAPDSVSTNALGAVGGFALGTPSP